MTEHQTPHSHRSDPVDRPGATRFRCALTAAALVLTVLSGCSNSILRNAAEAGYETVTDAPLPTPTAAR